MLTIYVNGLYFYIFSSPEGYSKITSDFATYIQMKYDLLGLTLSRGY